ncbi:MAG TPA: CPBP family intramembrane glutamic endopeptidase [Thermomicrobiales bacterium]|nr:CPBP family intramembrane glutamic endopeptidase [Thermomicrobiales bacterium]
MQDFIISLLYTLILVAFFYGVCAFVQLSQARPGLRYVIFGLFGTVGALILLLGLLSLAAPQVVHPQSGRLLLVLGVATLLPLFRLVRALLAKVTPLDPTSTIDTSGLVVLLWLFAIGGTLLFTIDLSRVNATVTVGAALLNELAYVPIAFSLVGIFVTRTWRESVKRLGLERPTARQVAIALGLVVPLLVLAVATDYAGRTLQPAYYQQVESVLKSMSSGLSNPLAAIAVGGAAGVCEEILFRGAIQPRFGIPLTALAFATAHAQYGASLAIVGVFITGLVLGYERKYFNTTTAIITHAAYDIVAFLLNAGG